jgi:hypothetical protein
MDREEIGSTIGLGLGLALLGIGFTMRGDLNHAVGTAFVVLGLLLLLFSGARLYRHERRKRGIPPAAERVQAGAGASLSLHLREAPPLLGAAIESARHERTEVGEGIEIVDQQLSSRNQAGSPLYVLKVLLRSAVAMDRLRLWCTEPLLHQTFRFGQIGESPVRSERVLLRNPEPFILEVRFADSLATKGAALILEVGAASPLTVRRIEPMPGPAPPAAGPKTPKTSG